MCLLLDHGLRVGEVALLRIEHFDLQEGTFTFDRPKVNKVQKHSLTVDTQAAARAYITQDVSGSKGWLLVGSRRGGRLTRTGTQSRKPSSERTGSLYWVGMSARATPSRGSGVTG